MNWMHSISANKTPHNYFFPVLLFWREINVGNVYQNSLNVFSAVILKNLLIYKAKLLYYRWGHKIRNYITCIFPIENILIFSYKELLKLLEYYSEPHMRILKWNFSKLRMGPFHILYCLIIPIMWLHFRLHFRLHVLIQINFQHHDQTNSKLHRCIFMS